MSNENNISLSQEEVDRLLGENNEKLKKETTPVFKRVIIAEENEISKFDELMKKFTTLLKTHLKEIFSEQGIRRLTPAETIQMSRIEFMNSISERDFLFLVEIGKIEFLIKFDSFLFCSLSGISLNVNHKSNLFQNETIRKVIAPVVIEDLIRAARKSKEKVNIRITPLFDLPALEGLKTETAGICASFTWNEGFRSIGTENLFFQKDFLDFLLTE